LQRHARQNHETGGALAIDAKDDRAAELYLMCTCTLLFESFWRMAFASAFERACAAGRSAVPELTMDPDQITPERRLSA